MLWILLDMSKYLRNFPQRKDHHHILHPAQDIPNIKPNSMWLNRTLIATQRWPLAKPQLFHKGKLLWFLFCMSWSKFPLKNMNRTKIQTRYNLTLLVWLQSSIGEEIEKLQHYGWYEKWGCFGKHGQFLRKFKCNHGTRYIQWLENICHSKHLVHEC